MVSATSHKLPASLVPCSCSSRASSFRPYKNYPDPRGSRTSQGNLPLMIKRSSFQHWQSTFYFFGRDLPASDRLSRSRPSSLRERGCVPPPFFGTVTFLLIGRRSVMSSSFPISPKETRRPAKHLRSGRCNLQYHRICFKPLHDVASGADGYKQGCNRVFVRA